MPIPDFQTVMRPLLQHLSDGQPHDNTDTLSALADVFELTHEELKELLPSGKQSVFTNRVAWAKSHLKQAGLIESAARGVWQITPRGRDALKQDGVMNMRFLNQFEEYQYFRVRTTSKTDNTEDDAVAGKTPQELIALGYRQIREQLADDLLKRIKLSPPDFFERLVVEVLLAMGYGGSREDAGQAVGKGGDGGIDGIIKEDRLGLDTIYIQAKRWEGVVARPEIQKFAGALQGRRARKGIFITTSGFTREAEDYAASIDTKIVLIDGPRLAELMIDSDVGVTKESSYDIKKIDSDYFAAD